MGTPAVSMRRSTRHIAAPGLLGAALRGGLHCGVRPQGTPRHAWEMAAV